MLGAVIDTRRRGTWGVTVLERLLAHLFHRREPPPAPAAPRVATTPLAERRRIDDRLHGASAHLAELTALAGLDELRTRSKELPRDP